MTGTTFTLSINNYIIINECFENTNKIKRRFKTKPNTKKQWHVSMALFICGNFGILQNENWSTTGYYCYIKILVSFKMSCFTSRDGSF